MGTTNMNNTHDSSLIFENNRLETFSKNWQGLPFKLCKPENFAAAGFYNFNTDPSSDLVKCFACSKELSDWEEDDDPWKEHVKRGAKCPFVQYKNKENPTLGDFLELQYESIKIYLNNRFEEKKKDLLEMEKMLLKKINDLEKQTKK